MEFSRRSWQAIAILLFASAFILGVCGWLFGIVALEPTESMPDPAGTSFWVSRGCCIGPAFALAFLAYLALVVARRQERAVSCGEVVAALGVALGLVPLLLGVAIVVQPAPDEGDVIFAPVLCMLPGLVIIVISILFWAVFLRARQVSES
jgi:hypothetical protein